MKREPTKGAAPLEWLAAAIGLLIFATLFATIFAHGLAGRDVPNLVVEDVRVVPTASGSLTEFAVTNRSRQTAAAVVVEGKVDQPNGEVITATVTIDYVPARSTVRAGLIFPGDVRGRRMEIRPVGYRQP